MKYHISVTAGDIHSGMTSSAHYCPIALAAIGANLGKQLHPESMFDTERVAVTGEIRVYRGEKGEFMERGSLPQEAVNFVRAFDAGRRLDLRPFEFDVEVQ